LPKKQEGKKNPEWIRLGEKPKARNRARSLVRIRDNYTCQDCGDQRTPELVREWNKGCVSLKGRSKLFDVHHTNGECGKHSRGYDSTKDLTGLITLCHSCHYNRHDFSQRLTLTTSS
jgi:hypothetical protein